MSISCKCGRVPAGFSSHEGMQSFSFLGFATSPLPPSSLLPTTPALPLIFHEVKTAAMLVVFFSTEAVSEPESLEAHSQDCSALHVSRSHLVCTSFGFCWTWLQDQDGLCKHRSSHLTAALSSFIPRSSPPPTKLRSIQYPAPTSSTSSGPSNRHLCPGSDSFLASVLSSLPSLFFAS